MKEILEELKEQLVYESDSGNFLWLVAKKGRQHLAGTTSTRGYRVVTFNDYKISCTKIAWYFMTGEIPDQPIGFKDGNSLNLKWENLKLTTQREMLATYRSNNEKLNNPTPVVHRSKVVRRAQFTKAQVKQALEEFITNKVLIDDRYTEEEKIPS